MTVHVRVPRSTPFEALRRAAVCAPSIRALSTPDDRRFAARREAETPAYITAPDLAQSYAATIVDTSSTGALVRVFFHKDLRCKSVDELPERLVLVFQLERVAIDCGIVWRGDGEMGVRFLSPARSLAPTRSKPKPVAEKPKVKRYRLF